MWTLVIRIALALGAATLLALGVNALLNIEGYTIIELGPVDEYEIPTGVALLTLILLPILLGALAVVALRGVSWVMSLGPYLEAKRRRRGVAALSRALVALAEGDGARARAAGKEAEAILDEPDLTRIVNAQAARLAGMENEAEKYYEAMAEDKDTAFVGLVGLLGQAMRDRMPERALRLAERAHALKPTEPQVIDALFDLQLHKGDWAGARKTLKAAVKAGRITRDVADRRKAVLFVAEAEEAEGRGEAPEALDAAMAAVKSAPGLTPAVVIAARLLTARGEKRSAARILIRSWRAAPHPSAAEAFAALDPNETPDARLLRFQELFDANTAHRETRETKAELALAADQSEAARLALGSLAEEGVSARACALMAAIEEAQGAEAAVVRGWFERAAAAPRRAHWICSACGAPSPSWRHSCGRCDGFDTLEWRMDAAATVEPEQSAARPGAAPRLLGGIGERKALPKGSGGALVVAGSS